MQKQRFQVVFTITVHDIYSLVVHEKNLASVVQRLDSSIHQNVMYGVFVIKVLVMS